jgi:hypothetical protein
MRFPSTFAEWFSGGVPTAANRHQVHPVAKVEISRPEIENGKALPLRFGCP